MPNQNIAQQNEINRCSPPCGENVPGAKIRVFLTDDHPLVRVGMAEIVGAEPDMEVCGEAGTIAQAMKLIEQCRPDTVCVDISLAGEDGIDLVKRIHSNDPAITILVYTMHDDEVSINRAMQAGAQACLGKKEAPDRLVKTIRLLVQS